MMNLHRNQNSTQGITDRTLSPITVPPEKREVATFSTKLFELISTYGYGEKE
jgi:hypothetical protein